MQENINIINALDSLNTKTGVSKAGNSYNYLELVFINGYKTRLFLKDDSTFAVKDAINKTKTELKNENQNSNKTDFWD